MSVVVVSQNVSSLCAVRKARQKKKGVQGKDGKTTSLWKSWRQKFSQASHMQASELGVADELCLDEFKESRYVRCKQRCNVAGGGVVGGQVKPSVSGEEPVTIVEPKVQDFLLQTGDTTVGHLTCRPLL